MSPEFDLSDSEALPPTRRFLVEIRGVLQVDLPNSEAAWQAAQEWIRATGAGEGGAVPPEVQVWWLRVDPEREDAPGWRRQPASPDF